MPRRAYTVHYHDHQHIEHEVCAFADDSYDARLVAIEMDKYLKDHPHAIDKISLKQ